jgi:hypothetical protein
MWKIPSLWPGVFNVEIPSLRAGVFNVGISSLRAGVFNVGISSLRAGFLTAEGRIPYQPGPEAERSGAAGPGDGHTPNLRAEGPAPSG